MKPIYIANGDLVLPERICEQTSLTIQDGVIAAVGEPPPADAERVDASGRYVLPGLIDLHSHGRMIDLSPPGLAERLAQDCLEAVRTGVTRYLVTLASAPVEAWLQSLFLLFELMDSSPGGAIPIGIHYEGIFLNPQAGGAHPQPLLQPFDRSRPEHRALFEKHQGKLKMITFAPEVPGNEAIIEICRDQGVVMALGHSAAGPEEVRRFAALGVTHMTHLFNGMKPLDHREPGPPAAGLVKEEISVDLICDGFHLHPETVRLIHRCKKPGQRMLITDKVVIPLPDSVAGAEDEPNRLPDGRLAGSRLRLNRAVLNYQRFTGCPIPEAVAMASLYPAQLLGIADKVGSLTPGQSGDVVIAGRELEVEEVFIAGRRVSLE